MRNAWATSQGAGIVIGIVDDGLQWANPDLLPNFLSSASWDFNENDGNPEPYSTSAHGTAVAGVAAARGDNSIGVAGVAPLASLAGLRLTALPASDAQEASAFGYLPSVIDILNNSWNPSDNGTTLKGPGPQAVAARQSAVINGRQGKGRVFVWSSGNGRLNADDCNFDGYANSRFVIAVGAATDGGNQVTTSEACSALMLLAPSGGGSRSLTTTDLIGTNGYDPSDYTSGFGNSSTGAMSGAAPSVSGAVALMLARNPNLTWRDVQHILRRSSVRILPTDPGWTVGPYPHNERLGFGLLDAEAASDMAAGWTNVPAEEVLAPATKTVNQAIPDINATGINSTITIAGESDFVIEHIELDFNATHTWRGDLQVTLTSPAGVLSRLATIRPSDSGDNFANWKFGSVRHWGETAGGTWTLNVADRRFQDTGTWNSWTLRIYGYHTTQSVPGAFAKTSPANGAQGQSTSPTLSWGASSSASSYQYCYDTSNDNACSVWTSTGANTSVALSGLAPSTSYYWNVRATNASGTTYADGSAGAFRNFTTQSAAPAAFGHYSPANGATGQSSSPTLAWGTSSGATSYEYCIDTSNNNACNATWTSNGTNNIVSLTGLTPGTSYYWHVRATNAAGTTYADGSTTAFWSITTIALPGAFTHTGPANGATAQSVDATLTWGTSTGAASYEYCIDTSNNNACNAVWTSTGTSTSVGLSGLTANTPYYWHVRATNGSGTTYADASATAFWTFTTQVALPAAFGHYSPANGATGESSSPTLAWGTSTGATSYEYCIDTSNDNACNATWTSNGTSNIVGLTGLTPGTSYYWHVRATNAAGTTYADGSTTAFWSFVTTTVIPPFGQVDTPSQNASELQGAIGVTGWALDNTGVTGVKIYRNCLAFEPANCQTVLGQSVVFVGDAVFLEGARPDVASAYPTYPNNTRAGWGFLMLTPLLPHVADAQPYGGQGPLTLYVVATDVEGTQTLLGRSSNPANPDFATPTSITM
ncbi:MAG TPA: S8 family serine peptidase, partial [Vicinamibacterales bacterium]|nr:S8 family serine peptidase [Vicinamibacterales bacterium]